MYKNFYKIIFNRNLGLLITVCETAHNNGKLSKDKICKIFIFNVSGNTHLDGSVIASKADKDKNYFSTGTLTFNNIAKEKSYESTAGSVSFSAGTGGMSFVPTLSHFEDEEHGTTHAAIFNNGTVASVGWATCCPRI
ncbi:MAG: hypothetical protein IJV56_08895 [Neisseriaceae bacterium]|nr:hypothetical protein [Neisseriaceae bacterium]